MAASREEVYEQVKGVLVEQLGIDEDQITEGASFQEDLDADSLDLVELRCGQCVDQPPERGASRGALRATGAQRRSRRPDRRS